VVVAEQDTFLDFILSAIRRARATSANTSGGWLGKPHRTSEKSQFNTRWTKLEVWGSVPLNGYGDRGTNGNPETCKTHEPPGDGERPPGGS
jgi:hypothetical protein